MTKAASSVALATLLTSLAPAQAQGPQQCLYANAAYSHGAIYAGTRCDNGRWISLPEMEFRRLYPQGLEGGSEPIIAPPAATEDANDEESDGDSTGPG